MDNSNSNNVLYTYFVKLLKAALNGTVPDNPPENYDWKRLYVLADKHSVTSTVYHSIMQLPQDSRPDESVLAKFKKSAQIVVGMGLRQEIEIGNLMSALDEAGIGYIPLKGWHMKKLYPSPDMRYMCDVDILIEKKNSDRIPAVMKQCGFDFKGYGTSDLDYCKDGMITVEMHWALFGEQSPWYEYFKDYYNKSEECEAGARAERRFSKEDFFLHMLVHMAKHFTGSGIGIRSVMDIYVYRRQYDKELDWDYLENELETMKLKGFLHSVLELAQDMFGAESDDIYRRHPKMAMHVLSTCMYGDIATSVKNSIIDKYDSKFSYMLHRIFLNKKYMKTSYPCLEKAPFLLPVFWIVRLFRIALFSRNNVKQELGALRDIDDSEKELMKEIMKDSGLM